MRNSPPEISSSPLIMRSVVDLPQPDLARQQRTGNAPGFPLGQGKSRRDHGGGKQAEAGDRYPAQQHRAGQQDRAGKGTGPGPGLEGKIEVEGDAAQQADGQPKRPLLALAREDGTQAVAQRQASHGPC